MTCCSSTAVTEENSNEAETGQAYANLMYSSQTRGDANKNINVREREGKFVFPEKKAAART